VVASRSGETEQKSVENSGVTLEKARSDCQAAYERMTSFLARGEGDTKDGMKAYDDYVKAKAAYDKILAEQKDR
jgi:hypothetical protein